MPIALLEVIRICVIDALCAQNLQRNRPSFGHRESDNAELLLFDAGRLCLSIFFNGRGSSFPIVKCVNMALLGPLDLLESWAYLIYAFLVKNGNLITRLINLKLIFSV